MTRKKDPTVIATRTEVIDGVAYTVNVYAEAARRTPPRKWSYRSSKEYWGEAAVMRRRKRQLGVRKRNEKDKK